MNDICTDSRTAVRVLRTSLVACLIGVLGACAATSPRQGDGATGSVARSDKPAGLEKRVIQRWELLIAGRADDAYDFLTPGYRTTVDRREYARNSMLGPLKWLSANWRSATCSSEDACEAEVLIGYSARMAGAGDVASINLQKESWLLIDGEWYFLPK